MFLISPWMGQCHSLPSGLDNNNSILSCHIFHAVKWSNRKKTQCPAVSWVSNVTEKTQYFVVTAKGGDFFARCSLWSQLHCRDVKVFEAYRGRASLGPMCSFWSLRGATLITMFLENVACPQESSEDKGGNALWEPHNSQGMHGMRYLNCHLTCRLQSSLISINTEARNVNVYFPEREEGKKKVVLKNQSGCSKSFPVPCVKIGRFCSNTTPAKCLRGS